MFDTYAELLPILTEWLTKKFRRRPRHRLRVCQAVRAKALDATPASCQRAPFQPRYLRLGQAYESLLLHMRAHPCSKSGSTANS